ncbi:MAG: VIT family protein [Gammaproteobacteria bacterium]|nr:VIT family protein [Gammaproteobacteria bacterium]
MPRLHRHRERHVTDRIGWLRAAVLGANDGIVSTASLMVGVAAAEPQAEAVLVAGVAGLVAGAMSMAAGEYVSVSSQGDAEAADLAREQRELDTEPEHELDELSAIYVGRGLDPALAREVAVQLMDHDALAAHARDELGLHDLNRARPLAAAGASAAAFAVGAAVPLASAALVPAAAIIGAVVTTSVVALIVTGALAANAGGASRLRGITRVTAWGAFAMSVTWAAGRLFGA